MASERDLELLDDYIGNRLNGGEREAFEQKLQADVELQRELKLQKSVAESLRKARAAELKAMLNNIPPGAIPAGTSSVVKWASAAVAIFVAVGLYFYLRPVESDTIPAADTVTVAPPASSDHSEAQADAVPEQKQDESGVAQPLSEQKKKRNDNSDKSSQQSSPAVEPRTPAIDVFDPTAEGEIQPHSGQPGAAGSKAQPDTEDLVSEIISNDKTYTFHYQFKADKLVLYGAFDKNLYEILEFITDNKRTIFLYYKNSFYLLNQNGEKVKALSPVNDPVLIQKLTEHRRR